MVGIPAVILLLWATGGAPPATPQAVRTYDYVMHNH